MQVGREVLDAAARAVKPGVTTDELDRIVHEATIAAGAYFLLFIDNFILHICSSPRSAQPWFDFCRMLFYNLFENEHADICEAFWELIRLAFNMFTI